MSGRAAASPSDSIRCWTTESTLQANAGESGRPADGAWMARDRTAEPWTTQLLPNRRAGRAPDWMRFRTCRELTSRIEEASSTGTQSSMRVSQYFRLRNHYVTQPGCQAILPITEPLCNARFGRALVVDLPTGGTRTANMNDLESGAFEILAGESSKMIRPGIAGGVPTLCPNLA